MRNLLNRLWADDSGAVIAPEWVLFVSIVIFGSIVGMVAVRNSMAAAMGTLGNLMLAVLPSFTFSGFSIVSSGGTPIAVFSGVAFSPGSLDFLTGGQTAPAAVSGAVISPAP